MRITVNSSCRTCVNYLQGRKCLAFIEKIPDTIWFGENDHTKRVTGDHGIRYEPVEKGGSDGEDDKG